MLRRRPERGGFWQPVTGAPFPGESDGDAAVREVYEETGLGEGLVELAVTYSYALHPELAERWEEIYGSGVGEIHVTTFAAEAPDNSVLVLDPTEHVDFRWCSYKQAHALLDWPIETDALAGRREALETLADWLRGAVELR